MTMRFQPTRIAATLGVLTLLGTSSAALAASPDGLMLACENGRSYPIRATAVSIAGELVTGYLVIGPRQSVHIRLVPMGVGYRYAGRGVWFDGVRGDVTLNFGPHRSVDCTASYTPS